MYYLEKIIRTVEIFIFLFFLYPSSSMSDIHIKIDKGIHQQSKKIAIIPFEWSGLNQIPENIDVIITNDLSKISNFEVEFLKNIKYEVEISEENMKYYKDKGINYILLGTLTPNINNKFVLFYKLIGNFEDLYYIVFQRQITINYKQFRYIAHSISNEIFENLNKRKGIFNTKISYVEYDKNNKYQYRLMVSDYDGYNQISIHNSSQPLMSPSWSPDGKKIAFVTFETGHAILVIQNLETSRIKKIVDFPRHNGAPSWSPDGKKIAFSSSRSGKLHIYIYDINNDSIRQITYGNNNNTEPSWFPDNEYLAYTSDKDGYPQIYKINIYNYDSYRISWNSLSNQNANVSKDGNFLAMVNINNGGVQNISILNLKNNFISVINDSCIDESPSFSPNGDMIVYSSYNDFNSIIKMVSFDGINIIPLSFKKSNGKFPTWSH